MKTDILLAVFNGGRFLPELLSSLENQTDGEFRVLWQDDGSGDGSAGLIRERSRTDGRFVPGEQQGAHLGAVGNFFSLLSQSEADRILLCDQDDIWEKEKVASLKSSMELAEAKFGRDTPLLIHSDCMLIDENGSLLSCSFFRHQGWDPAAIQFQRLLVQNNVTGCTLIMNRALRDLAVRHGRPDTMFMHDWFLALTASAFGQVIFLDRTLTRYRQHAGNTVGASSRSLLRRALDMLLDAEKGRKRIRLTYSHTRAFLDSYQGVLPQGKAAVANEYLASESLPKLRRVRAVRRIGCIMQSPVARIGQILFG